MQQEERLSRLARFLGFLHEKLDFKFNIHSFNDRIKLQKYVFIGRYMGWRFPYIHSIYVRGPYSTRLARDYYRLSNIFSGLGGINLDGIRPNPETDYSEDFNIEVFQNLLKGKDVTWLEVASTMLSLRKTYSDTAPEELGRILLMRTKEIKHRKPADLVEKVYFDLISFRLIPT